MDIPFYVNVLTKEQWAAEQKRLRRQTLIFAAVFFPAVAAAFLRTEFYPRAKNQTIECAVTAAGQVLPTLPGEARR